VYGFLAAGEGGFQSQQMMAYAMFIIGLALVITEIFLPGVILGLMGLAGVVVGIVLAFSAGDTTAGAVMCAIAIAAVPGFLHCG